MSRGQRRHGRTTCIASAAIVVAALLQLGISPVAGSGVSGIDVVLPTGVTVSGTVTDSSSTPLAGIGVGVCRDDPGNCGGGAQTAADGSFTIHGLTAGTYFAGAFGDSSRNLVNTFYTGGGGSPNPADAVAFEVSGATTGIDITMSEGLTAQGTIRDPDGQPVAGVNVSFNGTGSGGSADTDALGHYFVGGLASGFYNVFVRPPIDSPFTVGSLSDGSIVEDFDSGVSISGDTTDIDATLVRGRMISGNLAGRTRPGRVTAIDTMAGYAYDLAPNGDFTIPGLWPDQPTGLVFEEADSNFGGGFPIGVYDGTATLSIDQSTAAQIDLSGGDVTGLDLGVPVTPSVQGQLVGEDGGVPHGWISLCGNGGCGTTGIGASGEYALWNLPADTYTLRVTAFDYVDGYVTANGGVSTDVSNALSIVVASGNVTQDVTLPVGLTISGHVTGPLGEAVVGGSVSAFDQTVGFGRFATTDGNGDYVIRALQPGDYTLGFNGPDGGDYLFGYWSETGYTPDFESAGVVHVAAPVPSITGTSPANGATGVSRSTWITATFSGPVLDVNKRTVWLHAADSSKRVDAKVVYDAATNTITLKPSAKLRALTTFVVEINGLTGGDGTALDPTSFLFTTGRK